MSGPDEVTWGWDLAVMARDTLPTPPAARPRGPRPPLRSRSPRRDGPKAAPPLRRDAPGRLERRRGLLPELAAPEDRAAAAAAFDVDIYAASTRRVLLAKLETVERALAKWGHEALPPTDEKVAALGATLKAGGYRSASSYLSAYRGMIERAGFQLDGPLVRSFKDAVRSCERGLGGPTRTLALRLETLGYLPGDAAP